MIDLLQKYPMIYVDEFRKSECDLFYFGVKNSSGKNLYEELPVLSIEGMGQTVEFNIRKMEKWKNKKLLLAAVKLFEVNAMKDTITNLEYHIFELKKQCNFYLSTVEARMPEGNSAVVFTAEMVHKMID